MTDYKAVRVEAGRGGWGGPLAMFIKEDIFVSGVGPDNVKEA